ncbi:M20/M25/M40 family metallo-hydrolase [Streptomyces sp. NPDC015171]|uniref:M20/M25/M40 family metallo-hydrolase n=1 Tax=Streptomyces sp. NPDC015171 TaxID=3364945 RepID=UPI0036F94D4E
MTTGDPAEEETVRLLRAMLSIPSVSGDEARLAAFLAEWMTGLGMTAWVDAAGNAHGVAGPPDAPTVLLLGHLDTVPGAVPNLRVGDLLYGRGAVDAKGPLAAMIVAASRSRTVRAHVVGAVGEEVPGSRGARHLLETLPAPDAVVIGEPSGWDGICLGYKGRVGVVYRVDKPLLHTSSPEPTAVEDAVAFCDLVRDHLRRHSDGTDPVSFDTAAATLVELRGDLGHAEAFLTCRVPPGFDFDLFERRLGGHSAGVTAFDERVPAVRRPPGDPVARALRAAVRAQGGTPVLKLKAGTSDMNVVDAWHVPMAAYGPGDAHLDHTSDEHIAVADLTRAVAVLDTALARLGGLLGAKATVGAGTAGRGAG